MQRGVLSPRNLPRRGSLDRAAETVREAERTAGIDAELRLILRPPWRLKRSVPARHRIGPAT